MHSPAGPSCPLLQRPPQLHAPAKRRPSLDCTCQTLVQLCILNFSVARFTTQYVTSSPAVQYDWATHRSNVCAAASSCSRLRLAARLERMSVRILQTAARGDYIGIPGHNQPQHTSSPSCHPHPSCPPRHARRVAACTPVARNSSSPIHGRRARVLTFAAQCCPTRSGTTRRGGSRAQVRPFHELSRGHPAHRPPSGARRRRLRGLGPPARQAAAARCATTAHVPARSAVGARATWSS